MALSLVSSPSNKPASVRALMAVKYHPTSVGLPSPISHGRTAMKGATAAPSMDDTLYDTPEPVYRTFVGNSSGSRAPIGPKVHPIRLKPIISQAITPMKPALRSEEHTSELQSRENIV